MNINSFIWSIADDVLHHVYDRTKYRDIILPMTVIRRLDAVLEPTRAAVLARKAALDVAGIPEAAQGPALDRAAGQAFHNRSPFTLRQLLARPNPETQKADFEAYLDGFSENVREVITRFKFREELGRLAEHNRLHALIEKFCDERINLAPTPVRDEQGRISLPSLDNHTMGTIFEELLRRFNEDYNQGAGEQFTPRDIVEMMAELVFRPIKDRIGDGTYLLYDDACGTGGMLTVGEAKLRDLARKEGKKAEIHLYGQELNPETYAICKADLLLKGEGDEARNIAFGSTLSADAHGRNGLKFDFMMANPPFGTTWKIDLAEMGGKAAANDPRFVVEHDGLDDEDRLRLLPRVSDGQLLFLVNKLSKMKDTPLGSRIADVHNGSALFTGEAGSGESNVRRWIFENDWLEAIVALPLNIFYNTGIATYVWVLSNRKADARRGKVQLVDATKWFRPLRRNLGKRNCEMTVEHIQAVLDAYETMETSDTSIVLPNSSFGYWKIVVERPLRLRSRFTREAVEALRFQSGHRALREVLHAKFGDALFDDFACVVDRLKAHLDPPEAEIEEPAEGEDEASADDDENAAEAEDTTPRLPRKTVKKLLDAATWARDRRLHRAAERLMAAIGDAEHDDFALFEAKVAATIKAEKLALKPAEARLIARATSWRAASAKPIVKSGQKEKKSADPRGGLFEAVIRGKAAVVSYEPDKALSDTEIVAFDERGGIEAFFEREVLPHAPDAWIDREKTKIGYEISFARHFYKPNPPRPLAEIKAEIDARERQTQALLDSVLVEADA
jgi:type I restriction enzyme M protein